MKLHFVIIAGVVAALTAVANAKEDAARLELKPSGDAVIQDIKFGEGAQVVSQASNAVSFDLPVSADQWKTGSIKFKVSADTELRIRLSARFTQADDMWVFIDNVKAEGAEIQNPDFEGGSGATAPAGWKFLKKEGGSSTAVRVTDAAKAASGESFVKVSHGCPVVQMIHVPKDKEVTLTFSARSATQ